MAPTLPDFPIELLLYIAESGTTLEQIFAHTNLRATCRTLNNKLVHNFELKHFHTARPKLTRTGLRFLLETSNRSIGRNIQTVELSASTLFTPMRIIPGSGPADDSICSWATIEQELSSPMIEPNHSHFNNELLDILADGSCASMLSGALSALSAVKSLKIRSPSIPDGMKATTLHSLRKRWTLACKVLLSAVLSRPNTLEELRLEAGQCDLAIPISTFAVTAADTSLSDSITKLDLSLAANSKQRKF
ncbi:hypothetical protein FB567DRAFT_590139 [Paraphoma chrysanthemicola]|uniref:F-box domain-containing protein n=1 Tax=Paraphoma chrysanthemicola TaxID=798071 RepID=A0A8K0W174_9PLEO|nr:hypothetical protein FB567DRAFT_590139 [Paraphoma chrysanthemicola]